MVFIICVMSGMFQSLNAFAICGFCPQISHPESHDYIISLTFGFVKI